MGNSLTSKKKVKEEKKVLTTNTKRIFKIKFGDEMIRGYDFSTLEKNSSHKLIKFLDTIVGKCWNDVDRTYKRKTDHQDIVKNHDITHYGTSGSGSEMRIHGYIEEDTFVVVRIDPNHKFHS